MRFFHLQIMGVPLASITVRADICSSTAMLHPMGFELSLAERTWLICPSTLHPGVSGCYLIPVRYLFFVSAFSIACSYNTLIWAVVPCLNTRRAHPLRYGTDDVKLIKRLLT
jgi:hypothetical protein